MRKKQHETNENTKRYTRVAEKCACKCKIYVPVHL